MQKMLREWAFPCAYTPHVENTSNVTRCTAAFRIFNIGHAPLQEDWASLGQKGALWLVSCCLTAGLRLYLGHLGLPALPAVLLVLNCSMLKICLFIPSAVDVSREMWMCILYG